MGDSNQLPITLDKLAEETGMKENTLRKWIELGDLSVYKKGQRGGNGSVLVTRDDFRKALTYIPSRHEQADTFLAKVQDDHQKNKQLW